VLAGEEWYEFRQAVQQDMMKISSALHYLSEIQDIAEVCAVQQDMMKIRSGLHYLSEIQDIA